MINAVKKALDALEREQVMAQDNNGDYTINVTPKHITEAIAELRAALSRAAEPSPVAMRYDFDGFGWFYIDSGSGSNWRTKVSGAEPLYTRPTAALNPLSRKQRDQVFESSEQRLHKDANLSWWEAIITETEAAHGIKETP
jgi:hypothetical protein